MACAYCRRSGHNSSTCTSTETTDQNGWPIGCSRYGTGCFCERCTTRENAITSPVCSANVDGSMCECMACQARVQANEAQAVADAPWLSAQERSRLLAERIPFGCGLYATNCRCERCVAREVVVDRQARQRNQ